MGNNDLILQNSWFAVARLAHVVIILQNPEPEVEFDTVANEKKQHEVNVGECFLPLISWRLMLCS